MVADAAMATPFRSRIRNCRRRRTTKNILSSIVVVWWHVLLWLSGGTCMAYQNTARLLNKKGATGKENSLAVRSSIRVGGVLRRQGESHHHHRWRRRRTLLHHGDKTTLLMIKEGAQEDVVSSSRSYYDDWLFDDRRQRVAFYGILAVLETIFWYWLAPGIDPESRWFNPSDGQLIASLLEPSTVLSPPTGSGLGFSSVLLNSFLILPTVWSLLLLQEETPPPEDDDDTTSGRFLTNYFFPIRLDLNAIVAAFKIFACAGGFLVGGGILIPYMIVRPPRPFFFRDGSNIDPVKGFPALLRLFEEPPPRYHGSKPPASNPIPFLPAPPPIGQVLLLLLTSVVLVTFFLPFFVSDHNNGWITEWNAFTDRARSSQFTALALFDFVMISITVLDPIMDDAIRRGYVDGWDDDRNNDNGINVRDYHYDNDDNLDFKSTGLESKEAERRSRSGVGLARWRTEKRNDALRRIAPFVAVPLIGPVAWIWSRPRYTVTEARRESA